MLIALTLGFMSFEELSKWFRLTKVVNNSKIFTQKRIGELSNYADYIITTDGINITKVKFPYYIKRNKTRDDIYVRYINGYLKKQNVAKEEDIVNRVAELSIDEPEVAKEYTKQILKERFVQKTIYKVQPEDTQAFLNILKSTEPNSREGLSVDEYNKIIKQGYQKARMTFSKQFGYTPQEVGVYYERA